MLKKVETKCKRCKKEFCKKRTEQEFCSAQCRNAAWKKPRKRRLKCTPRGSVANGHFSSSKSVPCKAPSTPDLGAFVRAQIETHQPASVIAFTIPDGRTGNVVLASDAKGNRIVGDARWWRVNILEHLDLLEKAARRRERRITQWKPNAKTLNRPIIVVGRNEQVKDMADALGILNGFRVRLCIDTEKELQVLGCGWRIVTCQFRGNNVLLHHNGSVASMKRQAFKELVAANRRLRRKRPKLRLVISNPEPSMAETKQAA